MKLFKPNKKYTSVALHALGFCCAAIVVGAAVFHLPEVWAVIGSLFSALSPIAYGLIFAYLLRPAAKRFETLFEKKAKRKWLARYFALGCTYLCLSVVLFGVVRFLIPLLVGDATLLGERIIDMIVDLAAVISDLATRLGLDVNEISIGNLLRSYYDAITAFVLSFAKNLLLSAYEIILGLFLSVAVLYHREHIVGGVRRLLAAFCPARLCNFFHSVATYSDKMFGKYIIGKIAESSIVCAIYIIVLLAVKMPYAVLVAIIMTVTNLIPVLGAYIGGIPSALIICTVDPKMLIWFLVIFVGIEQVNANIIAPKVLGSILGLRSVWIMVSVALFGAFFGIWGMFLSAPLFSIIYALIRDGINSRLEKKGERTDTDHYTDMFASTVPPRRRHILRRLTERAQASTDDTDEK